MKAVLFSLFLITASGAFAEEAKDEWQGTSLSDETIHKIQQAQYGYKKCVIDAMRQPEIAKQESRYATDSVMKKCEPVLGDLRKVLLDTGVPPAGADRQLKHTRIQVTRNVLQELMYAEAAKKSGQP
jgi:hypothetical protein